ncbi:hypothetical protein H6A66_12065 [Bacteroides caecigallinarum]|uniref:hypothetical protein n=1 Tax=Bacteroides caecigallinarum TaxID=1411144 RepID=UPI00195771DD|nr:hypothetical protein [Bacteroides caecigallinarum]MBM6865901.1 hypothetical protein [Bacteroides caecigallinarum]
MKNNILGFIVYFLTAIVFSSSTALILLAMKENSDRCHYYNGKWSYIDLIIGLIAISIAMVIRYFVFDKFII